PSPASVANWVSRLQSGWSRGRVMLEFTENPGFKWRVASARRLTQADFTPLRRLPDAAGRSQWITLWANGATTTDTVGALLGSPEYAARFCANARDPPSSRRGAIGRRRGAEEGQHLVVRDLVEAVVPVAHRGEALRLRRAHDLVGIPSELDHRLGCGHRHGEHHPGGVGGTGHGDRGPGGGARRDAVVPEDGGLSRQRQPGTDSPVCP